MLSVMFVCANDLVYIWYIYSLEYIRSGIYLQFHAEQDMKGLCFICNLPSHEFERRAKGFDHHVKHDHNMWDYIYFSIYLDQIDTSDHNAIQKFVYDQVIR